MSLPVSVSIANPVGEECPNTFLETLALLRTLISAEVTDSITPYVIGQTTPAVEEQDYIWFKLDSQNRPVGIYRYYDGVWRKVYTANPSEIRMFSGDPSLYFDADGLGKVGEDWDGWALCNGENNTVNLTDRFVVGGKMTEGAIDWQSGGWRTHVTGTTAATGGAKEQTIADENLPEMTVQLAGKNYSSGANEPDKKAIVDDDYSTAVGSGDTLDLATFGQATPDPLPTLPPFLALGFAQFVGYA